MSSGNMRGLTQFVSELRDCQSREMEEKRVAKEMANIRDKFTSKKALQSYDRRKYVWKMVYTHMIGFEVDFGHAEVVNLVSSGTYADKQVGYLAASVLFKNDDRNLTLMVETIRNDLRSSNETIQCLALCGLANIGGNILCEALYEDVFSLLAASVTNPMVRKKATLCALRMYRVKPAIVAPVKTVLSILDDRSLGVVLAGAALIHGYQITEAEPFATGVGAIINLLARLALNNGCTVDYMYYSTACPWLQVRLLRVLQAYPIPADATLRGKVLEILTKILTHTEVTKSVNKNNGDHSILFEALQLLIHYAGEIPLPMRLQAVELLGRFLRVREPNIRYLALDTMAKLTNLEGTSDDIRKHQATVLGCLKEADISIRLRALDLLFAMADKSNAVEIARELLDYLTQADFGIKEELVLKLAILAERFSPNYPWYVDTVLEMIETSGDCVSDDIWHRVIQIVTNNADLQYYAARKIFQALSKASVHEVVVKLGGYIIGEFGYVLAEAPTAAQVEGLDTSIVPGDRLVGILLRHFDAANASTQAMLLTAFVKLQNLFPDQADSVQALFTKMSTQEDAELQQRACEYQQLPQLGADVMETVVAPMPEYAERESALEARLRAKNKKTELEDKWGAKKDDAAAAADAEEEEEEETAAAPAPAGPVQVTSKVTISEEDAAKLPTWFNKIVLNKSGIVFENGTIQIGMQLVAAAPGATANLFVGNKTSQPLLGFRLRVPGTEALTATVNSSITDIGPGEQARLSVDIVSMAPFADPLPLQVSFVANNCEGHAYLLKLPVVTTHFLDAIPMSFADFTPRWDALVGEDREAMVIINAAGTVNMDTGKEVFSKLGLNVVSDASVATPTIFGVATFRTAATNPTTGQRVSVGVLARLDGNPARNAYRLIVRAHVGAVSQGVKNSIAAQLGTPVQ